LRKMAREKRRMVTSQGRFFVRGNMLVQVVQNPLALALFCWSKVKRTRNWNRSASNFQAHTTNCTRICISVIKAHWDLFSWHPIHPSIAPLIPTISSFSRWSNLFHAHPRMQYVRKILIQRISSRQGNSFSSDFNF
jgi:hypothetical protein